MLDVLEDGTTASLNALKKACVYFEACNITGRSYVNEYGKWVKEIKEAPFYLVGERSMSMYRGNPLDVLSIDSVLNKYYTEISDEDFLNREDIFEVECKDFIRKLVLK